MGKVDLLRQEKAKKQGVKDKSLFFTPAAKGAIVWSGCRPTGALFWKHGLCLVGLHNWEISWGKIDPFSKSHIAKGIASGRIRGESLFFTPAAKGASFWSGCRPTRALFRNQGLCPWGSTIGKFLGKKQNLSTENPETGQKSKVSSIKKLAYLNAEWGMRLPAVGRELEFKILKTAQRIALIFDRKV